MAARRYSEEAVRTSTKGSPPHNMRARQADSLQSPLRHRLDNLQMNLSEPHVADRAGCSHQEVPADWLSGKAITSRMLA